MGRPIIVVGDKTDHGGTVVQGSSTTTINGVPVARVGDTVTCPKRNHGSTVIVTGDPNMLVDGKPVARHGDKTACGATLMGGQGLTFCSE